MKEIKHRLRQFFLSPKYKYLCLGGFSALALHQAVIGHWVLATIDVAAGLLIFGALAWLDVHQKKDWRAQDEVVPDEVQG